MKNLIRILLCLCLVDFAISRAISLAASPSRSLAETAKTAQKKPSGKKATAKELVANAKKALAAMQQKAINNPNSLMANHASTTFDAFLLFSDDSQHEFNSPLGCLCHSWVIQSKK